MIKTPLFTGLTCVLFVLCSAFPGQIGALPAGRGDLRSGTDSKYHVGDVWEYKTRTGEETSRFTIVRIDNSAKLGVILHIGVDNLSWKTCQGGRIAEHLPHMPFTREAIQASAGGRIRTNDPLPQYEEGYAEWKAAFIGGHAGVYTIPIKDAVSLAEQTWRTGMGCGHNS